MSTTVELLQERGRENNDKSETGALEELYLYLLPLGEKAN